MKEKRYMSEKDLKRARKIIPLFVIGSPFVYMYGLLENHFSPSYTFRGYNEQFLSELKSIPTVLFKGYYYDDSIELKQKERIRKARKKGFKNANITASFYKKFSTLYSYVSNSTLNYHNDGGQSSYRFTIKQVDKDKFKVNYDDGSDYSPKGELNTDYLLNEQQVLEILDFYKNKK